MRKSLRIRAQRAMLTGKHGTKLDERRLVKYVPTTLELYPCCENHTARVSCSKILDPDSEANQWRVSIWGDDDYGIESDYSNMNEAIALYNSLDYISEIPKGFKPA